MLQRILGGIYLSSYEPIEQEIDLRRDYNIEHVLSVIPGTLPDYLSDYTHLQIEITDEQTTNILEHMPAALSFMDNALFKTSDGTSSAKHNGAVLVHCAHGQSRSVAFVVAYLMYKYNLSLKHALHAVNRKSVDARPNDGFIEQLELFARMGNKVDKSNKLYRDFLIDNSLRLDPSGAQLRDLGLWPDAGMSQESTSTEALYEDKFDLRCKRCSMVLATERDIECHDIPEADSRQSHFIKTAPNSHRIISSSLASKVCSHYFLGEPVSWMSTALENQDMEGKFLCPRCDAKVGGYSWKGSRCSCGKWMIPALHLQTAKVDSMKRNTVSEAKDSSCEQIVTAENNTS